MVRESLLRVDEERLSFAPLQDSRDTVAATRRFGPERDRGGRHDALLCDAVWMSKWRWMLKRSLRVKTSARRLATWIMNPSVRPSRPISSLQGIKNEGIDFVGAFSEEHVPPGSAILRDNNRVRLC